MRKNEFYTAYIALDDTLLRPEYLGSFDNLAKWAYKIHLAHPNDKINLTANKVVFTDKGPTNVAIPPLDKSEIKEVIDLVYIEGDLSFVWLSTILGLATTEQLQLTYLTSTRSS